MDIMQLELDGSVYDTPTDEPVVYHVFEFFKAELLTDDDAALESLTHIDIVTQQLGPEECGTLLVPFLTEAQAGMSMSLLAVIVEVWYTLSKISNTESYIVGIFRGLEFFLSQEDPVIRIKGIDFVVNIVDDLKCSDASYDVIDVVVVPMLKRMSESEWFAEAISACVLIPRIYSDASEIAQGELRECYKQLWESNLMIVRLEVARNLEKLLAIMHIEHSVSMFWLVLKNMSVDIQEDIRAHCVGACLAFAKRCSLEQNLSFSYPVIVAAACDSSWRVRAAVAREYHKIYEAFGKEQLCEQLFEAHLKVLSDSNDVVQETAMASFLKCCHALSANTVERYITFFESQIPLSSVKIRQDICDILANFAANMPKDRMKNLIYPIMLSLMGDQSVTVRLCVLNNIELVCDRKDFETDMAAKVAETIEMVLKGTRWHHRLRLAEKTTALFHHFGFNIFEKHFGRMLFKLLTDSVWKVRNTVVFSIEHICADRKATWMSDTILTELLKMYIEPRNSKYIDRDRLPLSYSLKIVIIQALVAVSKTLDLDVVLAQVVPILITATKDSVANVRFVAVKAICNIFQIYKDEDPEAFLRLRCTLLKLKQDPDIDVRYYTQMALVTYEAYFDT